MIYLDTNIFIYAALDKGEKANSCKKILEEVALKKIIAFTSVLTWDEVVYSLKKDNDGFLFAKKSTGEVHVSLNSRYSKEILEFIVA